MQRALFARLLLQDASLILLDEPFTAIDAKTTADLLDLVRRWHGEARTVVAVLHDLEVVRRVFPRDAPDRARAGRLGRDRRGADADNLLQARAAWSRRTIRTRTRARLDRPTVIPDGARRRAGIPRRRGLPPRSGLALRAPGMTLEMLYDLLIAPFAEFEFMRRALVGAVAIALGGAPVGVFLMLRRMSLTGDAMAHAILPGAALGFLVAGLSLPAMTLGGLLAGIVVAVLAGLVARVTVLKEDASLAAFYLISLALGVTIVSAQGLERRPPARAVRHGAGARRRGPCPARRDRHASRSSSLAVLYRPLVLECVDPVFLRSVSRAGGPAHLVFLGLVVLNLVGGFQALGTLLAVGLMMLPAAAARFWSADVTAMIADRDRASASPPRSAGLLLSYHAELPSGPAIILTAGGALSRLAGVRPGGRPALARPPGQASRSLIEAHDWRRTMSVNRNVLTLLAAIVPRRSCRVRGVGAGQAEGGRDLLDPRRPRRTTSAATASRSRRSSGRTATRTSTRRRRPTRRRLADAKLVVVNGLEFEGWMSRLVKSSGTKALVVEAAKGVRADQGRGARPGHGHDHGHADVDPHAWQTSPTPRSTSPNIRDALVAADPAGKAAYEANAAAYLAQARRARRAR